NHPGPDTIVFDPGIAGGKVSLTLVGDHTFGPSALPVSSLITISGTGETITRGVETPFRLFYVTSTGNLTLDQVTLSNGLARGGTGALGGGGAAGLGGAIFNRGVLKVANSTLTANQAVGGESTSAFPFVGGGSGLDGDGGADGGPPHGGSGDSASASGAGG